MKLKILIGALVFLIVVNLATIGSFVYMRITHDDRPAGLRAPGRAAGPSRFGTREPRTALRKEHRRELRKLFDEFHAETQDQRVRIHELQGEAFALMQKDPVPLAQVDSLLEEISALHLSISKAATRKIMESREFLPPEQMEMFLDALRGPSPAGPGWHMDGGRGGPRRPGHRPHGERRDST